MGNENSKTQSGSRHHKNKTPHGHQNVEVDNFLKVAYYYLTTNPLYKRVDKFLFKS